MKLYKHRLFDKWAKKEKLTDCQLREAVKEIEQGLIDADLGAGLIKKRVAQANQGKRGGYRVLLAYRQHKRLIFLYGFSKGQRANLTIVEKRVYKRLADHLLSLSSGMVTQLVKAGDLIEVIA